MTASEAELLYRTHRGPQDAMMLSSAEELLYGGAKGGGKSYGLRVFGVDYCLRYPGAVVALFRRSYKELEDTHIWAIQNEVPSTVAEYKVGAHNLVFRNGSVIMFRFCEEDDDVYSYDTSEWDALAIDELTQFTDFSYRYLTTRVRSPKPWWPGPRIRCATTPLRRGHAWVKARFVDFAKPYEIKTAPPEEGGMTRQFIPATVKDNRTMIERDPKYLERLKILPEAEYRAAMGDWEVTTSQYFNRWRTSVHVCATFDIPSEWTRYMVVDYGYAKPYAVLWAARPPNTNFLWFYREHYGAGVSSKEQVRRAREAVPPDEKIQFCVLDPSMFSKRPEEGSPISDDWKALGIELIRGNNERIPGWTVMRECLDWTEGPGGEVVVIPRMHVMESCPNLIRTIPQLQMDKNNPEDADTEGEDHGPDGCRYLIRHLFGAPVRPPPVQYVNGPKGLMVLPARQRPRKLVGV